ncbi:MAG TPA: serine O-acetyltransferase [Candidatus Krumholzibacteria bacterium]|nr:serine O-acetyltransferase [Candidatus Krumholzibacteria bacterium]
MSFQQYRYLVRSDLYRISDRVDMTALLTHVLRGSAFKYNFWMRTCRYTRSHPLLKLLVYRPLARPLFSHYTYKFGISIPFETEIGSGFYIGHFGGIVVNEACVIGKNCNISHGVTLGVLNRGEKQGCPTIGDNVYIGPGAKIVGRIKVGNHVAVGANCVVTKDVPDYGVVVGIPGQVISQEGSVGYVNRTDYEGKI